MDSHFTDIGISLVLSIVGTVIILLSRLMRVILIESITHPTIHSVIQEANSSYKVRVKARNGKDLTSEGKGSGGV